MGWGFLLGFGFLLPRFVQCHTELGGYKVLLFLPQLLGFRPKA